jgi:hypothetical protein
MKSGIMQSLSRTEMKNILGGYVIDDTAKCSDSNCQKDASGVRKKCPTGCKCDSAEGSPCYKP